MSIAVLALFGAVNCVRIQRDPLLSWSPTPADDGPPKNYFVPHFGTDTEITGVAGAIAAAEKVTGTKFNPNFDEYAPREPPVKRNYFVPHFGEDQDIKDTKVHAAYAEKKLNHVYDPPETKPIKMDYFVPHFGAATEVKDSIGSAALAE